MRTLIVISSKSPNLLLYKCIDTIMKIQIVANTEYTICVVDSDSDDYTQYARVQADFPRVEILFVKNKNYEFGAWKYAFTLYPNFDMYFCIQDSMIQKMRLDVSMIDDHTAYIWYDHSGYFNHPSIKEKGCANLRASGIDMGTLVDKRFMSAQHSVFIVNNTVMKDIFDTLKVPPIDKDGSCFYERNFGLYFVYRGIQTLNMSECFEKVHLCRT